MRFLIDQPVSPLVATWLVEQGHDPVQPETVVFLPHPIPRWFLWRFRKTGFS